MKRFSPRTTELRLMARASRNWVLNCGERYWPRSHEPIRDLPMPVVRVFERAPALEVTLPAWAEDIGVDGRLLVEGCTLTTGEGADWERCDWITASFLHLTGAIERSQERTSGPIHSYSNRLIDYDPRRYDRAWVNRIFLFLRRWAARRAQQTEESLLGSLPKPEIVLTHDVDAVRKTPEIRFKQAAFHGWNSLRALRAREFTRSSALARRALEFVLQDADFRTFADIRALEKAAGLRSILHFYGGPAGSARRTPYRMLLDPGYDIGASDICSELRQFRDSGWTIGLHPSVRTWADPAAIVEERRKVEAAAGAPVTASRQHWLMFAWEHTWRAQQDAGLTSDSTLGFNDRPGFRNGAALAIQPWDFTLERPLTLTAWPMIFMDSHFYDYQAFTSEQLIERMRQLLDEVRFVRGQATVNWHTHTITSAYGWREGYIALLALLQGH